MELDNRLLRLSTCFSFKAYTLQLTVGFPSVGSKDVEEGTMSVLCHIIWFQVKVPF